jgi:Tol biopolymer transport system component
MHKKTLSTCVCLLFALAAGCGHNSAVPGNGQSSGGDAAVPIEARKPDTVSKQSGKSASTGRPITVVTREVSLGRRQPHRHGQSDPDPPKAQFSPDFRHVAFEEETDNFSRAWVVLDGVKHKEYKWQPHFGQVQFSPDSKRTAYAADDGNGKFFIVSDGAEIKEGDGQMYSPAFSPDSKRLAFISVHGKKVFAVVDGATGPEYDDWGNSYSFFSPDSRRYGYMACRDGNWFSVIDGVEGKRHRCDCAEDLQFSPDGSRISYCLEFGENRGRIAYYGKRAGKYVVVTDGIESKEYDEVNGIGGPEDPFSSDGNRIAHAAKRNGKCFAVIDGKEEKPYDALLLGPRFSLDSKHVAYVARDGGKSVLIIDGNLKQRFDEVVCTPTLSPDGARFAYSVKRGEKYVVGLDGVECKEQYDVGPPYCVDGDWISVYNPLAFSPDSRVLAYCARRGKERFVVVNGVAGPSYDDVETIAFTSDSKRAVYIAQRGNKKLLVVDGIEGNLYDDFIIHDYVHGGTAQIIIDSPTSLHTIVVRDNEVYRIEIEILEQ